MQVRQEIAKLLEAWLQLTEAEGHAIQNAAWPKLQEIQSAKAALQSNLVKAGEKWQKQNKSLPAATEFPFAAELRRLMSLESRNSGLLDAQVRRVRARQDSLNEGVRNLSRVKRCYATRATGGLDRYS